VDFGQQEAWPRWFKAMLFAWLRQFSVQPRAELELELVKLARDTGAALEFRRLYRGYADYAVITKPAWPPKKKPRTGEDGASRVPKSGTEPIRWGEGKSPSSGGPFLLTPAENGRRLKAGNLPVRFVACGGPVHSVTCRQRSHFFRLKSRCSPTFALFGPVDGPIGFSGERGKPRLYGGASPAFGAWRPLLGREARPDS